MADSEGSNQRNTGSSHAEREERILSFWKDKKIFERSVEGSGSKGDYTFYDGPPFATGLPHYGHILAGTIKDVIPRWKTMQGYRVRRRWGWDCHGLPVENIIEKELDLKTKKDILTYGMGKFNAAAKESVMRYADEWRRIVPRLGRWVDMDDDYRTMDASYTETVWWIFKQLYDKGLIYEGFKSMNLCPRCETTLSNFEVAQGYKDITDLSVYVKFEILNLKFEANSKSEIQNPKTYLLAWTTTPWTLPGNVALAVNPEIEYIKVKFESDPDSVYILAKTRRAALKDQKYEVLETVAGSSLVGADYRPLFDYYAKDANLKNKDNAWKIYAADFVTTEDGTGVVHIAPAFGADDYELLKKHNLPFVQHVTVDGVFKDDFAQTTDGKPFKGMHVKPKDTDEDKNAHQKADVEVIKWLAHSGSLFDKEKLVHSYPHCWRCDTPLLNYASSSWFVKVTDIKDKLVAENKKITWVPPEIGSARFGNWLEGARDWAISRSRFWGAPIPVWREEGSEGKYHVFGSLDDLKRFAPAKNTYEVMRHGESENNITGVLNSDVSKQFHLTEKGRTEVKESASKLKGRFDVIYSSPILRAKETAELVAAAIGFDASSIVFDDRLMEINMGELEGKHTDEYTKLFPTNSEFFTHSVKGVESRMSLKRRVGALLDDIEKAHSGKRILLITHDSPAWMLVSAARGLDIEQSLALKPRGMYFLDNAEVRPLEYSRLPRNDDHELDLHRPFIDDIKLITPEGKRLVRVPDVFDCWFESGSMPYGETHYPFAKEIHHDFEPKSGLFKKSKGYPADFIAEGLDQTRGWFYSMLVLGVALFGKTPYKKVIVNGLVLAEDGQKMSKRKNNYPDPMLIVDKYGADSLRYYMLSSPVVRGQDLRFSEKGVDEVTKKLVNRLLNVVSFYEMYADKNEDGKRKMENKDARNVVSKNVLDRWAIVRLNQTIESVTKSLEAGELDRACWPLMDLTDDLSTWFLRRSRDRFKGDDVADKEAALDTTKFVLIEMSKLLAPFMPFLAEEIYRNVQVRGSEEGEESVHLLEWPVAGGVDAKLVEDMKLTREIASKGLEARMAAKINVRQPLQKLKVKSEKFKDLGKDFIAIISEEVNVKAVEFGVSSDKEVELDTNITPELKEEGMVRELTRAVQDLRKAKGLSIDDKAVVTLETDGVGRSFIEKNRPQISRSCSLSEIKFGTVDSEPILIGGIQIKVSL